MIREKEGRRSRREDVPDVLGLVEEKKDEKASVPVPKAEILDRVEHRRHVRVAVLAEEIMLQ